MRLFPPRTPRQTLTVRAPRALTASSVSVGAQDAHDAAQSHAPVSGARSRIERALGYYDTLGECWYPAQFYARAMKRIRYYPAILNDAGEPEEVENGPLRDLFDQIRDPGGTSMMMLASNYGRLSFLIGDGYLLVSEQDGEEAWEYLSPLELKPLRGTSPQEYERNNGYGEKETLTAAGPGETVTETRVRVWRLWRRHPAYSRKSDAPVLSVLELYALLERLTLAAGATSGNRAALRDILYIPDEVTLIGDEAPDDPGVDEDMLQDSFMREMIEAAGTGIKDPGSIEAILPLFMRGPAVFDNGTGNPIPYAQLIARIQVARDNPYFEADAWDKVIERIALGLDMPNEMVTGTGKVNHWGGWLLDEQGFRQHVAGVVEEFAADMASAYLRPAAREADIANWERVVIWYDPVAAIAHPDEGPTAMDAWKLGAVGREYVRESIGAEDGDAPTPDDEMFLLELLGRKQATDAQAQDGETAPQDGGTGGDTTEAPPTEPSGAPADGVTASASFSKAAMIVGAAEFASRQARKAAGARLVQRSKNCGECQDAIRDVPLALVASTLGKVQVRQIIDGHTTEAALVSGAGDLLAEQVRAFGVNGTLPERLGAMVESHTLRTLYQDSATPLPTGFTDQVVKALG